MLHADKLQSYFSQLLTLSSFTCCQRSFTLSRTEIRTNLSKMMLSVKARDQHGPPHTPSSDCCKHMACDLSTYCSPLAQTMSPALTKGESLNPRLIKIQICIIYFLWPDLGPKHILALSHVPPPLWFGTMLADPA